MENEGSREGAQETHKKDFATLVAAVIPEHARDKPLELWWQML
jgi:hypothetical protein